jgi:hypothetical protein
MNSNKQSQENAAACLGGTYATDASGSSYFACQRAVYAWEQQQYSCAAAAAQQHDYENAAAATAAAAP